MSVKRIKQRLGSFQTAHRQWINEALETGRALRHDHWSEALAVGKLTFVDNIRTELGRKGLHRGVEQIGRSVCAAETKAKLTHTISVATVNRLC